jgi:hypothetical protein
MRWPPSAVGQRAERERLIRERTALVDVTPGDEHRLSGPAKEALEHRPAAASLPAVELGRAARLAL